MSSLKKTIWKFVLTWDDVALKAASHSLTLTRPFISEKFVALLAAALKRSHCVTAEVVAASIVLQALIDVWGKKVKKLKKGFQLILRKKKNIFMTPDKQIRWEMKWDERRYTVLSL